MEEVVKCFACDLEFHQSFLSAHAEAFHAEARKEEMIGLSCSSCSFSVNILHKNSMVQHCLLSGHNVKEVEIQFNSYLLSERHRIARILESSYEILGRNAIKSNDIQPENDKNIFPKKEATENISPEPIYLETELEEDRETKIMTSLSINKAEDSTKKCDEKLACSKCNKEITVSLKPSHTLQYAVGHVLSHLPYLKLFQCRHCEHKTKRFVDLRIHQRRKHNGAKPMKNEAIGTEKDEKFMRSILEQLFPTLQWKRSLNLLKYT